MEQRIRDRYTDAILAEARDRYGISDGHIRTLDGFESFIYEFDRDGYSGILRLGHSFRRTRQQVQAEVDWILYLASGGVSVAKPLASHHGNHVELINDGYGEHFVATVFDKAPGKPPARSGWPTALKEAYGRLIGRMHALSRDYVPSHSDCVRSHWNEAANLEIERYLPSGSERIAERYREVRARLTALPVSKESYGLIHQDAHGGNFFVDDNGRITLFDFDDCCYGHYVYDLAMVLFYVIPRTGDDGVVPRFWPDFWRGYAQENDLDPAWLREIPHFFKLREIDMYALLHRSYDVPNLPADSWARSFLDRQGPRIEAGAPYIDFDFDRLHELTSS